MEDPQDLRQRVIGALGAVLAVALVIGAVAGVAAYGAVRASGLGAADAAAATTPTSAPSASASTKTATPSASPTPTPSASPTPTQHSTPKPKKKAHHHARRRPVLTLRASRHHVSPMGRIGLRGRYPGHGGTRLLVQRRRGGHWSRFPVSVTVRGGSFRTWVASGHRGPNVFRVVGGGHASAPVTVVVG